jgi:hypothetical protein
LYKLTILFSLPFSFCQFCQFCHVVIFSLLEAVVGIGSSLVNRAVRDVRFLEVYQAVIVAIRRKGKRAEGEIGGISGSSSSSASSAASLSSVMLKEGDALLLEVSSVLLFVFSPLFFCFFHVHVRFVH